MTNNTVIDLASPEAIDPLTELLRSGAKKLIEQAVQAELEEVLQQYAEQKTGQGRRRVVRNGYQPERDLLTGVGKVGVKLPKLRSREGEAVSFQSALVPPYIRKTATLEAEWHQPTRVSGSAGAPSHRGPWPGCGCAPRLVRRQRLDSLP